MFLKTDCYRLGVISKLRSYKGEVTIYLDVDDPLEYKNLESVFVEYDNKLVPFFLEKIAIRPNGQAVVKFEDVETEHRAKTILKCGLYLPLDTLPELVGKEFYFHEIEGFEVIDEHYGSIGNVIHIIDQANNPLIAIDHEGIEILVPNQKQFIKLIDRDNKRVTIAAPEGLLDMYLGSDEEE
tara:strand:+ start:134 stop:679 length:546 start_codon:yes stop_codon:yes gene_type:complete